MTTSDLDRLASHHGGRIPASQAKEALKALHKKRSKYGNRKVTIAGMTFDSQGEARRYEELRLMELAGEIEDLRRQVRIPLIGQGSKPLLYDSARQAAYVADFVYCENGVVVAEDFKGLDTPDSKLKRAVVAAMWGRPVRISRQRAKPKGRDAASGSVRSTSTRSRTAGGATDNIPSPSNPSTRKGRAALSKPRGCTELMPFPNHRTMAEVAAAGHAFAERHYGSPEQRAARAKELDARRRALGWSFYKTEDVAGLYHSEGRKILRGVKLGAWPTLDLIDQALQRGERKAGVA